MFAQDLSRDGLAGTEVVLTVTGGGVPVTALGDPLHQSAEATVPDSLPGDAGLAAGSPPGGVLRCDRGAE